MPNDFVPINETTPGAGINSAGAFRSGTEFYLEALRDLRRFSSRTKQSMFSSHGRLQFLCEKIKTAAGAELVAIMEPFAGAELGDRHRLVRFAYAAGSQSETVTGVFSRVGIRGESAMPEALTALGFSDAILYTIELDGENTCLLGAFWKSVAPRDADLDKFLASAARLVQSELEPGGPSAAGDADFESSLTNHQLSDQLSDQHAKARAEVAYEDWLRSDKLSQAIEKNENRYRQIFALANEGICETTADGRVVLANSRLQEMTGFAEDDLKTKAVWDLIDGSCKPVLESKWEAIKLGQRQRFECVFQNQSGKPVNTIVSVTPLTGPRGEFRGALVIATDIEDRKAEEEELKRAKSAADEANTAKSQFLANMSHEIRTPLGAVLGFAELLLDETQPENLRQDCINAICRNGRQLLSLINDILDLSKVEAGRLEVDPLPFDLNDLVVEIKSTFQTQADAKGLVFEVEAEGKIAPSICSDVTRLRQIIFNLVGNALKFTQDGFVRLCFRQQGEFLIGEVSDSGYGVPAEQIPRLFSPFTQADSSISRKFGGTGLGLVLSRKLARALGGDTRLVYSEAGKGSMFEFRVLADLQGTGAQALPLPRLPLQQPSRTAPPANDRIEHVQVLVVDDAVDNRILLRRMLEKLGAHVSMAENGVEAVKKGLTGRYDIILMDIQMPVMDGCEATRELRAKGYKGPIIALTAHAMKEERELFVKSGCNRALTKPVDRRALVDAIRAEMRESLML